MQKVITVEEMEKIANEYTNIEEPIIVKRANKNDLVILSMEEYKKKLFLNELDKKIQEGEEDIKNGKTHKLRDVFKEKNSISDRIQSSPSVFIYKDGEVILRIDD